MLHRVFLVLFVALLVVSTPVVFAEVKMNYSDMLNKLSAATIFQTATIGEGTKSELYDTFHTLVVDGKVPTAEVKALIAKSTPAGKLYLAALIREIDSAQGIVVLRGLLQDHSEVRFQSGCAVTPAKVDQIAKSLLDDGKYFDFKLRYRCKT